MTQHDQDRAAADRDVAALPQARDSTSGDRPTTPTERALTAIWSKILASNALGLDDNFFKLGANSLQAYLACAQVSADLGITMKIVDIYCYPSTRELARVVDRIASERAQP
jgi:hypothetical protein